VGVETEIGMVTILGNPKAYSMRCLRFVGSRGRGLRFVIGNMLAIKV